MLEINYYFLIYVDIYLKILYAYILSANVKFNENFKSFSME